MKPLPHQQIKADESPGKQSLRVEVLTASGCGHCQEARDLVHAVAAEFGEDRVHYREVNVIEEIDYAVALRVLSTPAVVLDGHLVFTRIPSRKALGAAIASRLNREAP